MNDPNDRGPESRPTVIVALPRQPAAWQVACIEEIERVASIGQFWIADLEGARSQSFGSRIWGRIRTWLLAGTGWDRVPFPRRATPMKFESGGWSPYHLSESAPIAVWFVPGVPGPGVFEHVGSLITFDDGDPPEWELPSSLAALIDGRATSQRCLWLMHGQGTRNLLQSGHFRLYPFSPKRSEIHVLTATSDWPAAALTRINRKVTGKGSTGACITDRTAPGLWSSVRVLRRISVESLLQIPAVLTRDHWNVGVSKAPIDKFLEGMQPIDWLKEQPDRFVADPFEGAREGQILAEQFESGGGVGEIIEMSVSDERSPKSTEIGVGGHASYPFTFSHNGNRYCLPETARSRSLTLYTAERDGWRKHSVVMKDVAAVDPTVFHHDGLWWLFFTDRDRGPNEALFAFWAMSPLDGWTPHANNPVKIDIRSSRGAGTPFSSDGRLYRPAQDCSLGYGNKIVINEVVRLGPAEFEETEVVRLSGRGRYKSGFHTLSAFGEGTLVDGMRRKLSLRDVNRILKRPR